MNILIVDDEPVIRAGLTKLIDWNELGLNLLRPAESAEEALTRLESERPDILLTDVRMSGMTGLELASVAKKLLPFLEVIILSGYDDFTYTQEAIRLGVGDYLLKSCRPDDITKAVLKAKRRIEERLAASREDEVRRRQQEAYRLQRWVVEGETRDGVSGSGIPWPASWPEFDAREWRVMLVFADGWGHSDADQELLLFAVGNMLGDLLPCVRFVYRKRIVLVVCSPSPETGRKLREAACDKIERLLQCRLTVVAGKPVAGPENLHESYRTAELAAEYRPLLRQRRWDYEDVAHRRGGKTICSLDEERTLTSILLKNDPMALKAWVNRFITGLLDDPQATPRSVEAAVLSASIAAQRWLTRVCEATGCTPADEKTAVLQPVDPDQSIQDILFHDLFTVMELYHHRLAGSVAAHVRRAIAYIEEKIGQDVGLQQVADHVHLHPNHLSELFKKETGMKFADYVFRRKMERAKEILAASPAKISKVAAEVGYEDVKYFAQIFKKYTGMTPSEYRDAFAGLRPGRPPEPPEHKALVTGAFRVRV